MNDRFYHPAGFADVEVHLDDGEWHHFANVKRGRVGDVVELFDGIGAVATAEVVAVSKKSATLTITSVEPALAERGAAVAIATCIPKGERFRWLVEKAAELGVRRLIPLVTERSVVKPGEGKLNKARQWAVEAAKQSRTVRLMEIESPIGWNDWLNSVTCPAEFYVADPHGRPLADCLPMMVAPATVGFAIGPEGGWTDEELDLAGERGATIVSLGESILRIETAAITVAAVARLIPVGDSRD